MTSRDPPNKPPRAPAARKPAASDANKSRIDAGAATDVTPTPDTSAAASAASSRARAAKAQQDASANTVKREVVKHPAPKAAEASPAKPTPAIATPTPTPRAAMPAPAPRETRARAPEPPQATRKPASTAQATRKVAAPTPTVEALPTPPAWLNWLSPRAYDRLIEYLKLTRQDKPIGWLLLLWPTYWGLWLAAGGVPPIGTLVIFTAGVIVMRSAGCVINDYADRWLDAKVQRTRERPLAAGRVTPREALLVFAVLIVIALGLVLLTNLKTIYLSGAAVVLAVIYPFLKRHTYVPQLWLGAAFGMSIPMAFTAVTDAWPAPVAWLAFTANMLWSTAYDTYYAMVDRDDDLRAGAKSTAILFGDMDLVAIGVIDASFLLAMTLVGTRASLGPWYWAGLGVAACLLAYELWLARGRDRAACFKAFRHNHWVGLALFAGMAAHYWLAAPKV